MAKINYKVDSAYAIDPNYSQTSNIRHNMVDNKTIDHSDVVGASPVGAAPSPSSFPI